MSVTTFMPPSSTSLSLIYNWSFPRQGIGWQEVDTVEIVKEGDNKRKIYMNCHTQKSLRGGPTMSHHASFEFN